MKYGAARLSATDQNNWASLELAVKTGLPLCTALCGMGLTVTGLLTFKWVGIVGTDRIAIAENG